MNIHQIPNIFQSKVRLAVISSLITGEKTFTELKELTHTTDGNLSVSISKLEEAGYITIEKTFFQKKPRTTYTLTDLGRAKFIEYVELLESIISGNK